MGLKLKARPTFKAKVQITIPGEEKLQEIRVMFRHKKNSELQEWISRCAADNVKDPDAMDEVIESWEESDVLDDNGGPIPYSKTALAALFEEYPASASDFMRRYLKELRESRAKN